MLAGLVFAGMHLGSCDRAVQPSPPGAPTAQQQAPDPLQRPWFREGAAEAGITFRHVSGHEKTYYLPEIVCGGVGLLDHDGDGDLDIYLVQGGSLDRREPLANVLYRNNGDRTFTDVTAEAGVGDTGYGMGCACGDYDGDGDTDLYVTNVGANVLYQNNGDGTFRDATAGAGVGNRRFGASAAFVDHDGDGDLDLYVVNYVEWSKGVELQCYSPQGLPDYCQPVNYRLPAPDHLYRNDGDGTFTDISETCGLRSAFGNGLGVSCGDLNGDGRMDFYIANDSTPNQLWIQQEDGTFQDDSMLAGTALNQQGDAEAGMGVAIVDIDDDGLLDLFVTHLRNESNTCYRNLGNNLFVDRSDALGFSRISWPFTGFGLGFQDFDNDGRRDLYVANGDVLRPADAPASAPYDQPNQLLSSDSVGSFQEILPRGGTSPELRATSRGAAFGDLDGDGDVDIVVVNRDGPVHLLWNQVGQDHAWIRLRAVSPEGRDVLHTRLAAECEAGVRWLTIDPSYSYCSASESVAHLGLGDASELGQVTVHWPDGASERFGPLAARATHTLKKGTGQNP